VRCCRDLGRCNRRAFHARHDERVVRALNQVAFPVAGNRAVFDTGWPLRDRDGVTNLPRLQPAAHRLLTAANRTSGAQVRAEFPLQCSARLEEQGAVDRLMRHLHLRRIGIRRHEPPADLLWRPLRGQFPRHGSTEPRRLHETAGFRPFRLVPGASVRPFGSIVCDAIIPANLATDRRRRSLQAGRNGPARVAGRQSTRNGFAIRTRQRPRGAAAWQRRDPATRRDQPVDRVVRSTQRLRNDGNGLPRPMPRPHLIQYRYCHSRPSIRHVHPTYSGEWRNQCAGALTG